MARRRVLDTRGCEFESHLFNQYHLRAKEVLVVKKPMCGTE